MSDYGDSDDGEDCPGWEPKEDCLGPPEVEVEMTTEPFQCCGTKNVFDEFGYRFTGQRERVRRHVVEASASAPAKKWTKTTLVKIYTPFSVERGHKNHWHTGKCDSCYHQDEKADEADRLESDAMNEMADQAERAEQEGYERRRKERVKEARGEKKRKAHAEMQLLTPKKGRREGDSQTTSGSGSAGALSSGGGSGSGGGGSCSGSKGTEASATSHAQAALALFAEQLQHLKVPTLKELCLANHLMVSGSKEELALRLVKCRLHGHAGACPRCKFSTLEYMYPTPTPTSDLAVPVLAMPIGVRCKHRRGPGMACGFEKQLPEHYQTHPSTQCYAQSMADSPSGALHKAGMHFQSPV
ncbi:hypothetical protein B484DRAFT_443841 [Ochromonadaceae sp. CCMP2298]|nr:hypothetical protein B484DRAFT_443841 [Ochromonadaceae sp. CCMP2298]